MEMQNLNGNDGNNKTLAEIQEIRSELESLKHQCIAGSCKQSGDGSSLPSGQKPLRSIRYRGRGVKLAKKEEVAPAVNTATHVGSLAILHRNAKETRNAREMRIGYPADGTGFSRRYNIPSV